MDSFFIVSYLQVMILLQLAAWVYSELAAAVPLVSLEDTDDRNAAMGSVNYHLDLTEPLTSWSPVVSFCLRRWIATSAPFLCRGNARVVNQKEVQFFKQELQTWLSNNYIVMMKHGQSAPSRLQDHLPVCTINMRTP
ncbi:uncharacterized protein [Triticum aestivum]|uniref:uncharacterized protein isoform X2 n=1 Tax=Triticum aestivum TaxID=4565 RepID=UPI001D034C2E|nr:uncharacterized protein LOC123145310 isoform X2 [Triticum aestivum]